MDGRALCSPIGRGNRLEGGGRRGSRWKGSKTAVASRMEVTRGAGCQRRRTDRRA
jgi:hypothetical protein